MREIFEKILKCPKCKSDLLKKDNVFLCLNCRNKNLINQGIPILFRKRSRTEKEKFVENFYNTFPFITDPEGYYSKNNLPQGKLPRRIFKEITK